MWNIVIFTSFYFSNAIILEKFETIVLVCFFVEKFRIFFDGRGEEEAFVNFIDIFAHIRPSVYLLTIFSAQICFLYDFFFFFIIIIIMIYLFIYFCK